MSTDGRPPIPREDLLDALRQFAEQLGRTPTMREMRDRGPHSSSVYADRFGTWFEALDAAGLDPDTRELPRISTADLLDELRRLKDELGHTPTRREMRAHGAYGAQTYRHRFGSWDEAVAEAGLLPNRSGLSGKHHQIIQQLREAEQ